MGGWGVGFHGNMSTRITPKSPEKMSTKESSLQTRQKSNKPTTRVRQKAEIQQYRSQKMQKWILKLETIKTRKSFDLN